MEDKNPKIHSYHEFEEFLKSVDNQNGKYYELIDGVIYMLSFPSEIHQRISMYLSGELYTYLKGKPYSVYAPIRVNLFRKNINNCKNEYHPDVVVVCDKDKITPKGIMGAPDFIIEIASPSNYNNDYILKLNNYMKYGVREYWIVNPINKNIYVYTFENCSIDSTMAYSFNDKIKVGIFEDLYIDFKVMN